MQIRRITTAIALLVTLVAPSVADGYSNGKIPSKDLAPVSGGVNYQGKPQTAYLLRGTIAASWNTMNLCATADGVPLSPGPSGYNPAATAYRLYSLQVILRKQLGTNAAVPGSSNHGLAKAIDLRTVGMRTWIDHHGTTFGWSKKTSDAPWEWWHLKGGARSFKRPDPGTSARFPNLYQGSGGACQATAVKEAQRHLGVKADGEFGPATTKARIAFQGEHHIRESFIGSKTWLGLRKYGRDLNKKRDPRTVANNLPGQTAPMAGQDVKAVQGLLNARFKELGRAKYQVKVDGKTDAKFTTAVKRFQILANRKGAKLKVTGKVDDATYARLLKTFRAPTQKLRVTGEGAGLVARSEGLRLCPYRDAVGVPTQGYGHTSGVKIGAKCWTQKKALQVLTADLDLFGKGITRIVTVTIGSRQYNALVSWSFNVGLGAARGSTLMRELNRKHYAIAGNQFEAWNKAGGRVLLGLTIRRRAECNLYSKGSGASTRRKIRC